MFARAAPECSDPAAMAEIKFRCPECTQKIAVAESAAGVKIDCPTCHSRLVIPRSVHLPVEVLIRRKLAIVGGSADAVYAELQKAEVHAEKSADELKKLRGENAAAGRKLREENDALLAGRKALQTEIASLQPAGEQLAKVQTELASAAAAQRTELAAAHETASALSRDFTALRAAHDDARKRLSAASAQLAALETERATFAESTAAAATLRGQLADALKDLANARSSAEVTGEAHRAQLDAAKGLESGVRAELSAVQTRQMQAEERLAEQSEKFAALEAEHAEILTLAEQLVPLRAELAKAQEDLCNVCESSAEKARGFEAQLETARAAEAGLRAQFDGAQGRHAGMQEQLAEQAARLAELEKRATDSEAEAAAEKARAAALANSHEAVTGALAQAEHTAKERGDAARSSAEALAQALEAEKAIREYGEAMKAKLADAEKRHAAVSHGFSALKHERGELSAQLSKLQKERDEAVARAAEKSEAHEKLTRGIESGKAVFARIREDANAAASEKGRLTASMEKTAAEHAQSLARCQHMETEAAAAAKEIARLKKALEAADAAAKNEGAKLQHVTLLTESATALVEEKDAAIREALAASEKQRAAHLAAQAREAAAQAREVAAQARAEKAERSAADAAGRAGKIESERAALAAELSKKSAALEAMKSIAAKSAASPAQTAPAAQTPAASGAPTEREKALEAERDALATALDRAKQLVGVMQARRDLLRDEVATLRARLGVGAKITSGDEKPIAK